MFDSVHMSQMRSILISKAGTNHLEWRSDPSEAKSNYIGLKRSVETQPRILQRSWVTWWIPSKEALPSAPTTFMHFLCTNVPVLVQPHRKPVYGLSQ